MSDYPDPTPPPYLSSPEFEARTAARKRIEARRGLATHAVVYVVVNAFLVGVWWWTGAGSFWPGWVLGGWGIGLVMNAWDVLFRPPITEDDIDRELRRRSGP